MSDDDASPIGSRDEFIDASFRAVQAPQTLSTRDYQVLESTHAHVATEARRKAAAWYATKADEDRRRATAHPTLQPAALPPVAPSRLSEGEDIDSWWKRHAGYLAPVWLVDTVYSHLQKFAETLKVKNDGRDERIDALERRITELEQRPALKDAGLWTSGTLYNAGDIVSHAGSGWICSTAHVAGGGISHECFCLFVKRGRDGADARRVPDV